jgi:hypothetical protein
MDFENENEFAIAYTGVSLGVPVLRRDGEQFGFLEHVLAVDAEDIFEGIVVWVGQGTWVDRRIQRELARGHASAARHLEALRPHELRFVEADKIAAITVGYIRCDLDLTETTLLPPPSGAPVFFANAIDQAQPGGRYTGQYGNQVYGSTFGRARWRRE